MAERRRHTLPVNDLIPDEEGRTYSSTSADGAAYEDDVASGSPHLTPVPQALVSTPATALAFIGPLPNLLPAPPEHPQPEHPPSPTILPDTIGPLLNLSTLPAPPERPKLRCPASMSAAAPIFIGPLPNLSSLPTAQDCRQQPCPPLAFVGPLPNSDFDSNQVPTPPGHSELQNPAPTSITMPSSIRLLQTPNEPSTIPETAQPQHPPPSAAALAFIRPLSDSGLLPPLTTGPQSESIPEVEIPVLGWRPILRRSEALDESMEIDRGSRMNGTMNQAQEKDTADDPARELPDRTGWPESMIKLHFYLTMHTSGVLKGQRRDWGGDWDVCINTYIVFQRLSLGLDVSSFI